MCMLAVLSVGAPSCCPSRFIGTFTTPVQPALPEGDSIYGYFYVSSLKALNMKSRNRLEYCFGSTADIEDGSKWMDLYACSSFLLISQSCRMSMMPNIRTTSQYSPVASPISWQSPSVLLVSSALAGMFRPNLSFADLHHQI